MRIRGKAFCVRSHGKKGLFGKEGGGSETAAGGKRKRRKSCPISQFRGGEGDRKENDFYDLFFHSRREQEEETSPRALGRAALAEEEQRG